MRPKVFIVDDDEINNFLCKKIIKLSDFSDDISSFKSVDLALKFIEDNINTPNNLPDIIFLDINMPIKNGWDFIEEYTVLKEKFNKEIQIYMLSSSVYEKDVSRAQSLNMVIDYIPKPLSITSLQKIKV